MGKEKRPKSLLRKSLEKASPSPKRNPVAPSSAKAWDSYRKSVPSNGNGKWLVVNGGVTFHGTLTGSK